MKEQMPELRRYLSPCRPLVSEVEQSFVSFSAKAAIVRNWTCRSSWRLSDLDAIGLLLILKASGPVAYRTVLSFSLAALSLAMTL